MHTRVCGSVSHQSFSSILGRMERGMKGTGTEVLVLKMTCVRISSSPCAPSTPWRVSWQHHTRGVNIEPHTCAHFTSTKNDTYRVPLGIGQLPRRELVDGLAFTSRGFKIWQRVRVGIHLAWVLNLRRPWATG